VNIVIKKKDVHEVKVAGEIREFLVLSLAQLLANDEKKEYTIPDCDFLRELDQYATSYQGAKLIRKGGLISATDMLRHSVDFSSIESLLTAIMVIQAGGAQETNIKVENVIRIRSKDFPFDYHDDDPHSLAVSVINDIIIGILDSGNIFNFGVGRRNDLSLAMMSDALRRLRIEYNNKILLFGKGLSLIDSAKKLSRLLFSTKPDVMRYVVEHDLRALADNSPLCQWLEGTNVAIMSKKMIESVYTETAQDGMTNEFKRLKLYREHQLMIVEILDRLYMKVPSRDARMLFTADIERLHLPGMVYSEGKDVIDIRTPLNVIQFLDLNVNTTTNNTMLGVRVDDEIPNANLKMYSQTEDDLEDVVLLLAKAMNAKIKNFDPVRTRALERMSEIDAKEREFDVTVTQFFTPETLASIFADVVEVKGQLFYEFTSAIREINEKDIIVMSCDDELREYVYRTTNPQHVARFADYEKLIVGERALEVDLNGTLPSITRNPSIYDGIYCKTMFSDKLRKPLKYFDRYSRLLRPANEHVRNAVKFEQIRASNEKLTTFHELFEKLQIVRDSSSQFYAIFDRTLYQQFENKMSYFMDKLDGLTKKGKDARLGEKLTFTHYVNETIRPIIVWLGQHAGMRILPYSLLHPQVKRSEAYKMACFALANEILSLYDLDFSEDQVNYIVPESLISQIGLVK